MQKIVIIDLIMHLVSAVLIGALIYLKTYNLVYLMIFIMGAVFVDLDHLIDYFIYYKNKFRLYDFMRCLYLRSGKVYVFLHSWEMVIIILFLV